MFQFTNRYGRVWMFAALSLVVGVAEEARGGGTQHVFDYGPAAGDFTRVSPNGNPVVQPGDTLRFVNKRPVNIRICVYDLPCEEPCPDSRVVGGPNANELACTDCLASYDGVTPDHDEIGASFGAQGTSWCAFVCETPGSQPRPAGNIELLDGENCRMGVTVPAVSQWGLLAFALLTLIAGTVIYRLRKQARPR